MSLVDQFRNVPEPPPVLCAVGRLLVSLPDDERDALQGALKNPEWTHSAIRRALDAEGYSMSHSTVSRHRRGDCPCEGL